MLNHGREEFELHFYRATQAIYGNSITLVISVKTPASVTLPKSLSPDFRQRDKFSFFRAV